MYSRILIRYGELSLKGKNRHLFIRKLRRNIENKLGAKVDSSHDRMFIEYKEKYLIQLKAISGIYSFSPVVFAESKLQNIIDQASAFAKWKSTNHNFKSFAIIARRSWKDFELTSQKIGQNIGARINEGFGWKVNLKNPELAINIEVRRNGTYIFSDKILGQGGLPGGVNGRVLMMLSGGIDSPVASYQLIKKGIEVYYLAFVTPPQTDEKTKEKIRQITAKLSGYQSSKAKIIFYNFSKIMHTIEFVDNHAFRITLMRRSFYRIAERIAKEFKCLAIANGESLGQVASQTLQSINAINEVTNFPVLRPLICLDKNEIIKIAKEIGTYEISIQPSKESCELFAPKKPVTKPRFEESIKLEQQVQEILEYEAENNFEIEEEIKKV